ncbi:MAG: TIGR04222 domain-containing membrane protein [Pirellula sp.]|jgi:uncharacterized protein (TIGR04222 family)
MNPLEMNGPEFLNLYGLAIFVASTVTLGYRLLFTKPTNNTTKIPELDPWQLAYLRGGPQAVAQTAIIDLAAKNLIFGETVSGRFVATKNTDNPRMAPIPNALYRAAQMGEGIRADRTTETIKFECDRIKLSLLELGVLQSVDQRIGLTWPGILAFGAVFFIGVAKFVVGISREKPVGYLLLLILVCIGLAFILNYSSHLTREGKLALEKEIETIRATRRSSQSDYNDSNPNLLEGGMLLYSMHPLAIDFAAMGFNGIYGSNILDANTRKLAERMNAGSARGDTTTTGGCGGGSDGGSGCGGGGCGGCSS